MPRAPQRLVWGVGAWAVGLGFVVAFLRNRRQWWWIIPGLTVLMLGSFALEKSGYLLPGGYRDPAILAGVGLTFGLIFLLQRKNQRLRWTQYPAICSLTLAAFLLPLRSPWSWKLLVPLALLAVGLAIVVSNVRRQSFEGPSPA